MPPRLHASTLAAKRRRRHAVVVLTPTVVEERSKVVALFTTEASPIALAIEALGVASITVRRLMRQSGYSPTAIDTERRRCDRLVERLRKGGAIREHEQRFITGALVIMSVLHLTASHRAGGRGKAMADAYERAAEELAARWQGPQQGAQEPAVRTAPARMPPWAVGQRLVEVATGRTWWVDEVRREQPDLVGVIPDQGPEIAEWRAVEEFRRP